MTLRVRILGDIAPDLVDRVVASGVALAASDHDPDLDLAFGWDPDVAGVLNLLAAQPKLPWVHMRWAGIPEELLVGMRPYPAVLTNGSGAHGPAMAESVAGMILAHYKQHASLRACQQRREWAPRHLAEVRGQTVGIVGLGDLGGATARLLKAFGARVFGLRRHARPTPDVDQVFGPDQLADFLRQLDVLVLAAPLTRETAGLIGADELAALPGGAFVVNVGRGPLVDQSALVAALQSGHLGGAALDVFETEPLPGDSPLWTLPNVFVSPHCADNTEQSQLRGLGVFLDNLERFRRGAPLGNVVDRELGYRQTQL